MAELQSMYRTRRAFPNQIAQIYVGLGEKEQAIKWFNKAYEERSNMMMTLKVEPTLDSLRSEPKFQELVHRVGV